MKPRPEVGDYVRCVIPGRQRIVPCKVVETEPHIVVVPLSQRGKTLHRYQIPSVCIVSRINPKEVNKP